MSTEGDSGLGFGLKWPKGWMHDTLRYPHGTRPSTLPPRRPHFPSDLAHSERYVLALSHDEVVHGKGAAKQVRRRRGSSSRRCGCSLGIRPRSRASRSFSWAWSSANAPSGITRATSTGICSTTAHRGALRWTRAINKLVAREPALHQLDRAAWCDVVWV